MRKVLEFAAKHKIEPMTEIFPMKNANEAVARLRDNRARYRIVLRVSEDAFP